MNPKKTSKSDLENKRSMFLQIGLVISIAAALIALEWSSSNVSFDYAWYGVETDVSEELVPITVHRETPPPLNVPKPLNLLEIIYTDDPLEDEPTFASSDPTDDGYSILEIFQPIVEPTEVLPAAEIMPEFPGGQEALFRYLAENIKYPRNALNNDIQGRVFVAFVVNRDGKITDVKILRGEHPELDKEAMRVIELMPDWEPGIQNGVRVNVAYTVPVNFAIRQRF